MADDAVRSLSFDIAWDIEDNGLVNANKKTDNLKTSADGLFKSTDKANKSLSTSANTLAKDFDSSNKSVKKTYTSIRDAEAAATDLDTGFDGLGHTNKDVSKQMKTSADDLNDSLKETGDIIGKNEKTSKKSHKKMQDDEKRTGEEADDASKKVKKIGDEAEKAGDKTSKLGGIMGGIGKFAGAGLVAAGTAVAATGAAAISAGMNYDEYFKTISIGTGATGAELDSLMESFKTVGKSGDDNLGAVAEVIAQVSTTVDLSGKQLEDYTANILGLGDVTGDNFAGMTEAAAAMAKSWKLSEDQSVDSLDKIFVASQKTNVDAISLTNNLTKFGPALREMGYDMDTSIAMIGNWDKAGLDANKMLASMNRVTSTLSKKGVKDLAGGMTDLITKIQNATTEEEANAIAIKNFGNNGLMMSEAIRSGAFEVDELTKAIASSQGAIGEAGDATETFSEKLDKFKNNAELALQPIGSNLLDIVGTVMDNALPLLETLSENIGSVFDKITPLLETALENVIPLLDTLFSSMDDSMSMLEDLNIGEVFEIVGESVGELLPVLIDLGKNLMTTLSPVMKTLLSIGKTLLPVIIDVVTEVAGTVSNLVEVIAPLIEKVMPIVIDLVTRASSIFEMLMDTLLPIIDMALPLLVPLLGQVIDAFGTIMDAILPVIQEALPPLLSLLSNLFEQILPPVIYLFTELIDMVLPPLVDIINMVMSVLQPLIGAFISVVNVVLPPLIAIFNVVAALFNGIVTGAIETVRENIKLLTDNFKQIIDFVKNVFTGNWKGAWDNIKNIFSNIVSGFGNIFKQPINFIIRSLNNFFSGINKMKVPDWVPLIGGKGFHFDPIPELALGTNFFPGGDVVVGERGPEILTLPPGSKVDTNDDFKRQIRDNTALDFDKLAKTVGQYDRDSTNKNEKQSGDVYYNDFKIEVTINAENADAEAIERLRQEVKAAMPEAIEDAFEKVYLKNKPA